MFWGVEEERLREWGRGREGRVACQTPREGPQVTASRKHPVNIELDEHQRVLVLPGACGVVALTSGSDAGQGRKEEQVKR